MPDEWRQSWMVPLFKGKGDVQECKNYRGIKLMSQTLKVWERVVEVRLRQTTSISEEQFGFMPGKVDNRTHVHCEANDGKVQSKEEGSAYGICGSGEGV